MQTQNLGEQIQQQLAEQMAGLFEEVRKERQYTHYTNPDLSQEDADSIIARYSRNNALLSGTVSLIPGPFGMLAVVPEIVKVMHSQIQMVYDIGASYGKEANITKEVLLGVVISGVGTGAGVLFVMQGSTVLVKRASLRVFQKVVAQLSGRVTQQALKSAIGKWLPGVGAVAIAAWSHYMTGQIGKKAKEFFDKDIIVESDPEELNYRVNSFDQLELDADIQEYSCTKDINKEKNIDVDEELRLLRFQINPDILSDESQKYTQDKGMDTDEELRLLKQSLSLPQKATERLEFLRIKILVNLIKVDGVIEEKEKEFLKNIIQAISLSKDEITQIREGLKSKAKLPVDFQVLAAEPDEAIGLMVDLIAVAKRDGEFHITEKMYIKQVGKALNFEASDIDEMMSVVT